MGKISKETSGFIKAIAMLFVIIAHFSQWYVTQAGSNVMLTLMTKLGRYGVAMFFAISGYGLVSSASRGLDLSYFKKRFLNVYFPYVIIQFFVRLFTQSEWGIKGICSWLTGFDAWFVCVILIFYVIFYFGWKYSRHKIEAVAFGVLIVSLLLAVFVKDDVWYSSNFSFVVGIWFKAYEDEIVKFLTKFRTPCYLILGVCFAGSAVIYMLAAQRLELVYIVFKILASILWALLCMCIFVMYNPAWAVKTRIHSLGSLSLECYLLHRFVLNIIQRFAIEPIAILLISLVLTLVSAYAVNYLFGKVRLLLKISN